MTELKEITTVKIQEESQQRHTDFAVLRKETDAQVDALKGTFVGRLNNVERQAQDNEIKLGQLESDGVGGGNAQATNPDFSARINAVEVRIEETNAMV